MNFLPDSYLLHFHGKSTWDGGETNSQIEKRNKLYTEAFLKKWGKEMTQIFIMRKNFSNILYEKNLNSIFKQGKFKAINQATIEIIFHFLTSSKKFFHSIDLTSHEYVALIVSLCNLSLF